ncbi:hypothetical protein Np231112_155 [Synechococcus phage S-RIM2]|jgi:hypothetical protein|uniref:Plasmid stability protein n=3 Tax=Nerrivikvirus srim2 TaxID=2734125 RepID=A0A1D7RZJ7_9CAUD|nr:plasmid stability [Synechococcus phage S-RIM2 R1_1999]AGH07045.1 hypothetical protein SWUG_00136 [Synechococcus phage S-RIM2 R9_2006]AON98311.1 hypothetical protein LIS011010_156 [Synechococcus phage S-RIM2]AGH07256.1 hypothetical protein SWTG_00125 [Synechococcus phage S-RIM2 R1_1999]AON99599.1 hypothetical protein LIS141013_155 [Synechococcus phage S-RIM2]AOO00027.1 hypothetical protein Np010709_155 [Synechococcus phage S-RIM2]
MQKLINVVALLSGLTSLGLIGGSAYLLLNKDALIDQAKSAATKAATEAVANALPGMLDASMPELPSATGGVIPAAPGASPLPSTTGPAIPMP